jgi:methionyl-tRNA formyltransferase
MTHYLFTKRDEWSTNAAALTRMFLGDDVVLVIAGSGSKPNFESIGDHNGVLISFLCPWIFPANVLGRFKTAINFHPGSTDYPGIGCYNFAIYEGSSTFGAVCHHMQSQVDSGAVIMERRFDCLPDETVEGLKLRTMVVMLGMLHDLLPRIAAGSLPTSDLKWSRRAFTRRDLNALCRITVDMSAEEIKRRVRATTYPGFPGAALVIGDRKFVAVVPDRPPLA